MVYEVYHVGDLARDRETDPALAARAEEFLERGTVLGRPTRKWLGEDSPRGRGEGVLAQLRRWDGVYEYRFYPFRRRRHAAGGS